LVSLLPAARQRACDLLLHEEVFRLNGLAAEDLGAIVAGGVIVISNASVGVGFLVGRTSCAAIVVHASEREAATAWFRLANEQLAAVEFKYIVALTDRRAIASVRADLGNATRSFETVIIPVDEAPNATGGAKFQHLLKITNVLAFPLHIQYTSLPGIDYSH
jgi:hypothetical protein